MQPFSVKESIETCQENWGVTPRPLWATVEWGGRRIESASNIVFSNGLLDPWCAGKNEGFLVVEFRVMVAFPLGAGCWLHGLHAACLI